MGFKKSIQLCVLLLLLLVGCQEADLEASLTSEVPPNAEILLSTITPSPEALQTQVRLKLTTTSDWTAINLISGTTWRELKLISASDEASLAEIRSNQIALTQPISRAESGGSVELIAESTLFSEDTGIELQLQFERGNLGYTTLEISKFQEGEWILLDSYQWGGITDDGLNLHDIRIPAEQIFGELESASAPVWGTAELEPVSPITGIPEGTDGFPWWNDTIFYEIYVRSFFDSSGDGIGDLQGLIQTLDYLNDGNPETTSDLGVTGIWLMPIYPSPTAHGYNITDFKDVNPLYGDLDDLRTLLDEAHQRGIRVILDFMIGQTSNQHPWFLNSLNPASNYRDWYIWSDHDPGYNGSWGQPVWFYVNGSYLYSTYSEYSPDLNMRNPEVKLEVFDAARFWLEDVGVDGFRLDSAKHVIEEGEIQANSHATHQFWKEFREFYKSINYQALTVGEIWEHTSINAEYLQGDEFDLSFEFSLAYEIIKGINQENAEIINEQIELSYSSIPTLQFSTFLTNHDQDRLMDQVGFSQERNKVAASILLTAPGVPFLYYGEEIGMQGGGHDGARKPMQWSGDSSAGFTTGVPWYSVGFGWETFNVVNQTDDPGSLLYHYRNLIRARNQHAALRVGDTSVVSTNDPALFSILRVSQEEAILVLINLTGSTITNPVLDLENSSLTGGSYFPAAVIGEGPFAPLTVDADGGFSDYGPVLTVPPYATYILQLVKNAD